MRRLALFLVIVLTAGAAFAAECERYGQPVELSGTLLTGKWAHEDGNEWQEFRAIELSTPLCMTAGEDDWSPAVEMTSRVQVAGCVPSSPDGTAVRLRGVLWGAATINDRTPVVLSAECPAS